MTYQEIVFERRNDAACIGINRPEVGNASREQTLDELAHRSDFDQEHIQGDASRAARP